MKKNKIKTLCSAKKRFKKIKYKKFKHKSSNIRHILTKKSSKNKRKLRKHSIVSKNDVNLVDKCLPYK
ncbi:50S ribosomal protein L35 [endosymbiont of Sipalinus gigas]|uniref:50S ribosomal protein L35 n=1 Tax=endosymbiont of Sipalinus gigas TaxID=1972134 RepID=UPI000DC71FD5|nr:50S ribosomal protein L35 [endosymbiont of Sipalinus gigas]BBA85230.1 50S ribosomal protein L35 [endosymbiont of Sipalinus gigas]